jgi:hypothetical protein
MSSMNVEFGSTFSKGGNVELMLSEKLSRDLVNSCQEVMHECVTILAEKYGFDSKEAIKSLGMVKIAKKEVKKVVIKEKVGCPLPFSNDLVESCCFALRHNNGLYTQCSGAKNGTSNYCKGCENQMQKSGSEMPEYGTIQQRMAVDIMEYVDPKGRKPVSYLKVMKKLKITKEQAIEEAGKKNKIINEIHFVEAEVEKRGRPKVEKEPKEKGVKGRPKKSKKVLEIDGDEEDLFASLVAEANEAEEEVSEVKAKNTAEKAEKLAAEKAEKEAKKQAEKAEKEAKKQAEKAEKEAKLAAEKAEKEAKLAAEKAEKEAKKQAEKAEKEAKLAAEKAEKEAKKLAEKAEKEAKKQAPKKVAEKKKVVVEEKEEEEEPDVVKKIEFEGKKYLKSKKTGIVYDYEKYVNEGEQVVIGKWNENEKKIELDDAEEEEEEYDM